MPGTLDAACGKRRTHTVAEAHATGHAFDARAGDHQITRCNVHHAIYRRDVVGRAFAFHPDAQAVQHGVGVKREIGGIHGRTPLGQKAKILPTASGVTVSSPQVWTSRFSARQPVQ